MAVIVARPNTDPDTKHRHPALMVVIESGRETVQPTTKIQALTLIEDLKQIVKGG